MNLSIGVACWQFVLAVDSGWGILASLPKNPDFFLLWYVSFPGVLGT